MSWYRQYRPTTISGLHLQSVREQLEKLRTAKTFPHALLLTGPRGAGKTSTARIIAAMLNDPANAKGTPLKDVNSQDEFVQRIIQGNSLAVNEMDAASHRGIDDVRALKEQAYLPPQEGNTLVFILDEVHMLTTEAFNALLKLLEEPPSHVVFILATTEEHKVPATIVSRSTLIRFPKATHQELRAALEPIIKDQKLKIDEAALTAIVESVDGSFRDAVKLLEMVAAGVDQITAEHVQNYLRTTPSETVFQLVDAIIGKDEQQVVSIFNSLRLQNADQRQFLSTLLHLLHQDLILAITEPKQAKYTKRISQFLLAQFSLPEVSISGPIPFLNLELKSLELVFRAQEKRDGGATAISPSSRSASAVSGSRNVAAAPQMSSSLSHVADRVPSHQTVEPVQADQSSLHRAGDPALSMLLIEKWQEFVAAVEQRNSSLAALLRSAKASLTANGNVCVEVFYQFHRDQLKQPKFRSILDQACESLIGQPTAFEFQLAQSGKVAESLSTVTVPSGEADQLIQLAQEVFL